MDEVHKNKIDSADIVSFDIFDTLLTRNTVHPRDVFVLARELFNEESDGLIMEDFCLARVEAELYARKKHSIKTDVTLDDIYDSLGELYNYDDKILAELKKYELLAEKKLLRHDVSVFHLYEYAKRVGKRMIIVSDMYLPKSSIEDMLHENGIDVWEKLIVSSEDHVAKFTGSVYAEIVKEYGMSKIVHIGDNIHSDISWAKSFGIETIHIHRNVEELAFEKNDCYRAVYGGDRYRYTIDSKSTSVADAQFNIISGLVANYSVDNSTSVNQAVGYGIFGPLLLGYTQWLHNESQDMGVEHLYFLARDGAIMRDAYEKCYGVSGISSTYMIGSRRVLNFPNIVNDNFSVNGIDGIVGIKGIEVRRTLEYYGVDADSPHVKSVLRRVGLEGVSSVKLGESADKFKAALLLLQADILTNANIERKRILGYFSSIKIDKVFNPVVVDVGWNGSMQKAISSLMNKSVNGLYFAIHDSAKARSIGADMKGFFDARISSAEEKKYESLFLKGGVLIVESLFTNPNQASLIGLAGDSKVGYSGIEGEFDTSEQERKKVQEMHDAALQFIDDYINLKLPKSLAIIQRENAIRAFEWMVERPCDVVAELFGRVDYSDVASSVPELIGAPMYDAEYYKSRPNELREEYNRSFWKAGFAKNCEISGIPLDLTE